MIQQQCIRMHELVRQRQAVLTAEMADMDNAAVQGVVCVALLPYPDALGSYQALVSHGPVERDVSILLLALHQAHARLDLVAA
jgi:hypothetical protein